MFIEPMREQWRWRWAAIACCCLSTVGAALVGGVLAVGITLLVGGAIGAALCFFVSLAE